MKKNSIFHLFTATIFICLGTAASAQSLHFPAIFSKDIRIVI